MENKELALYKMHVDCGRMGYLEGVFVERKDHVKYLLENNIDVHFGEVLGKHSEVVINFTEEGTITLVTDRPDIIEMVQEFNLESGYNPFDHDYYVNDGEDDDYINCCDDCEEFEDDDCDCEEPKYFDYLRDYIMDKLK